MGNRTLDRSNDKLPYRGHNSEEARIARIEFLKQRGNQLATYASNSLGAAAVQNNIESYIGSMAIPVGIVGPLKIQNSDGTIENVYVPMATTEGALVASTNRGVALLNAAGGFRTVVHKKVMTRSPMFCFASMQQAHEFGGWLSRQQSKINELIADSSRHSKLVSIRTTLFGRNLACLFTYETGDAAGQNMVTSCTWQACLWIERTYKKLQPEAIQDFVLDCNASSDKKVTYDSVINGRGMDVSVECLIDATILEEKLKVPIDRIVEWYNRSLMAATQTGMVGYNVNIANPIAGIFAATGQDLASVHESSVGYFFIEKAGESLYATLRIPRLVIATLGGGTHLPSQKENLSLMGCLGVGKVNRLGAIIAGVALGLELSTFSAIANGQFAIAHDRMGRNPPDNHLGVDADLPQYLNDRLFAGQSVDLRHLYNLDESNGIISLMTARSSKKFIGLSVWEQRNKLTGEKRSIVIKSKASSRDTLNCLYTISGLIDPRLAKDFDSYKNFSDFYQSHLKEIVVCEHLEKDPQRDIIATSTDSRRDCHLIATKLWEPNNFQIFHSEGNPDVWSLDLAQGVLSELVKLHRDLRTLTLDPEIFTFAKAADFLPFSAKSLAVIKVEYGSDLNTFYQLYEWAIDYLQSFDESTLSVQLIHNDFNSRNIGIDQSGRVVVYDFELARIDCAERDWIEFVSYILDSKQIKLSARDLLQMFFDQTNNGQSLEDRLRQLKYSFAKYITTRINLYLLGNRLTQYQFLDGVTHNCNQIARELCL